MKAASAKRKGTKLEKWVAKAFTDIGFRSRRQPGSGIYQDFPHDVAVHFPDGPVIVEAKSWKHGWRTGEGALGAADILVIKRDFGDPCVFMPWRTMQRLARVIADQEEQITELERRTRAAREAA